MNTIPIEPSPKGRILVVDDEPLNRELLRDLLEVNGYTVLEAVDGLSALKIVDSGTCDVILLDVRMPGMDGLEVCRRLKANLKTAPIPVLMVTALVESEQRHLGIDAGANDYLAKPIDRRDVLLRVRNAVSAKRLYDQVQQDLDRLRELEKLQDNLTHMIVHDMRSPLMIVDWSYDFLLKEKNQLNPQQADYIAMGQSCCHELVEMVNSLLDISRMESGKMPLNRTPCDLLDIARKAAESVAVLALKKELTILVEGDEASVVVDRDILCRVFVNLLGNAIKFSPEGSTITIGINPDGETIRATVTDQGCGIPPEYHAIIFEKFGQVGSRIHEQKHSSGLGLTFCKLAVEAHGGLIGIESPSTGLRAGDAGKGSTFWFTIPIREGVETSQ